MANVQEGVVSLQSFLFRQDMQDRRYSCRNLKLLIADQCDMMKARRGTVGSWQSRLRPVMTSSSVYVLFIDDGG
jgi:hypothetical protein